MELSRCLALMLANEDYSEQVSKQWSLGLWVSHEHVNWDLVSGLYIGCLMNLYSVGLSNYGHGTMLRNKEKLLEI